MSKRRVETYSGIAIAATGFIFEIVLAIEEFGWGGWAALAAFGLALVALTAVLERRARAVRGGRNEVAAPQPLDSPVPSV
ncbi:MAG: hypothetical protein JRH14_22740 [Deltaproteobacteria bacterium]|nr:hypothetical protein [Deltaproteobacteria bacterium]